MGVKTLNTSLNLKSVRGRGLAWSRLRDLGSRDPGSNPGDPTIPPARAQIMDELGLFSFITPIFMFSAAI